MANNVVLTRSVPFALAFVIMNAMQSAHAMDTDKYLKFRREHACERNLSYTDVSAQPEQYKGKVIEIRGMVTGFVRLNDGLRFMLALDGGAGPMFNTPREDEALVSPVTNQKVRVLARVNGGAPGSGPAVETLAVARDGEVTLREKEAAAKEETASKSLEQRRSVAADLSNQPKFPSRGAIGAVLRSNAASGIPDRARKSLSDEALSIYFVYREYIRKCNKRLTKAELDDITTSVLYFAPKYRVDPRLVVAMVIAESDFDPRSTSHKGAMGLGQIMPDEARKYGVTNPYDIIQNLGASIGLLKEKLNMYGPNTADGRLTWQQVVLALAAYNAGPGAVKKFGGVPPYRETQGYIRRIISLYKDLCNGQ